MRWPGLGLAVAGLVGVIGNGWHLIATAPIGKPGVTVAVVVWVIYYLPLLGFGLLFAAFALAGGMCFASGRYRGLAVSGMVLGCIPLHWGMPLAVPFAVWGFVLLSDPDVQRRFDRR
jgi:Mn2+/Fe2+ NRAMP family transporter